MIPEIKQIKIQLAMLEQGMEKYIEDAEKMKKDYKLLQEENEKLKKQLEQNENVQNK